MKLDLSKVPDHMQVANIDWPNWQPEIVCTLMFVTRGDEVLLIRKKRGLGAGKINGPGGKVDPGETISNVPSEKPRKSRYSERYSSRRRAASRRRYAAHSCLRLYRGRLRRHANGNR